MLENIFSSIIEISLTSSIIILLLLVTPFMPKIYTAKWRYILWFILTIRLIIPFNITLPTTPVKLAIPTNTLLVKQTINNNQSVASLTDFAKLPQAQKTQEKSHNYSLIVILSYGWLLGASIFLVRIFIIYSLFRYKIKKNSVVVTDSKTLYILDQICHELNIKRPRICISKSRCSPMMYGFIKPTLFLSNLDYADYELELILRHELIHFKRHDLWYKLLLIFANAIHWFNPLVYLMVKSAHADIEFSCDDEVIKDYDITSRKLYSQTILNSIKKERSQEAVLSTQFKGGKRMLKNRFSNILDTSKKRKGTFSLLIATLCIVVSGLLIACTQKDYNEKNPNQNTNQPIDNPKNEDPKNVEDLTNNDTEDTFTVPYENNLLGFSLKLPADWTNLIGIKENYVEYNQDGGAGIEVYHIATRKAQPDKGTLFYIDRWLGTWTESDPPLPIDQNSIVLQTDKYTYMLRTPSDIQYNEADADMKESYNSMRSQIDIIKTSVKELNSRPSTPNAGYQTEAEFLSSPEGIQFRTTAYGAAKAVLTGDIDELKNYLVNPSDATKFINGFSEYQVDLIKFQCQFGLDEIKSDHEIITSYEFVPVGEDTNMYVSMELKKVNDEWLVDWLGAEQ